MGLRHAGSFRSKRVSVAVVVFGALLLESPVAASPVTAKTGTVVTVLTTTKYGSVLVVGGAGGPLKGYPLYEFSGDAAGKLGCGRNEFMGFDATSGESKLLTCTGPESDVSNDVYTDDWPALTTTGPPVAGPGVNGKLLGTVLRSGIGDQVTYGGHPLYLFDSPSRPFAPEGERYLETVEPFPPWHGFWFLVSSQKGQPAPGPATIETETLADQKKVVAVEMDPNVLPMAVTVYSYSKDHPGFSGCIGTCAVKWVPVLTTGKPRVSGGIKTENVGVIRRGDGTYQVTYMGKPLYLYSAERGIFPIAGQPPQQSGTAGNGDGVAAPGGGTFSVVSPDGQGAPA